MDTRSVATKGRFIRLLEMVNHRRVLFGSKLGLDNFTAIMDYNNLQGYGRSRELCSFEPVKSKWDAFGWHAREIDGHDICAIREAFGEDSSGKPKIIIAHTTKGKGVSFMEDQIGRAS